MNLKEQGYREIDGLIYPRVTTILNLIHEEGLVDWQLKWGKKESTRRRDNAALMGTQGHYLIGLHLKGFQPKLDDMLPQAVTMYESYLEWQKTRKFKPSPDNVERLLVSKKYRFCGTTDALEENMVNDWKSGRLWPKARVQLALYSIAAIEQLGYPINRGRLVRFSTQIPDFEEQVFDITEQDRMAALGLVKFYHHWQTLNPKEEGQ